MIAFNISRYDRLNEDDAAAHPSIIFSDRETYLAWVAAWKTFWHATVAAIREAKRVRRDKNRNDDDRINAQMDRSGLRVTAFNHLQLRKAAKSKANQARTVIIDA